MTSASSPVSPSMGSSWPASASSPVTPAMASSWPVESSSATQPPRGVDRLAMQLFERGWKGSSAEVTKIDDGSYTFGGVPISAGDYKSVKVAVRQLYWERQAQDLTINDVKVHEFFTYLSQVMQAVERVGESQGIPVLGITGAGKSSLINYLLGCRYRRKTDPMLGTISLKHLKDSPPEVAKTSHAASSETFLPNVYGDSHRSPVFIDTPGFDETRGKEIAMAADLGFCSLFDGSKTKGAIIVAISFENFKEEKFNMLRRLCDQLGALCKKSEVINKSLLFVITHTPEGMNSRQLKKAIVEGLLPRLVSRSPEAGGATAIEAATAKETKKKIINFFKVKILNQEITPGAVADPREIVIDPSDGLLFYFLTLMANAAHNNVFIADHLDKEDLQEQLTQAVNAVQLLLEERESIRFELVGEKKVSLALFMDRCQKILTAKKDEITMSETGVSSFTGMVSGAEKNLRMLKEELENIAREEFDPSKVRTREVVKAEISQLEEAIAGWREEIKEIKETKVSDAYTFSQLRDLVAESRTRLSEVDNDNLVVNTRWDYKFRSKRLPGSPDYAKVVGAAGALMGITSAITVAIVATGGLAAIPIAIVGGVAAVQLSTSTYFFHSAFSVSHHTFEYNGLEFEDYEVIIPKRDVLNPKSHIFVLDEVATSKSLGHLKGEYRAPRGYSGDCEVIIKCKSSLYHAEEIESLKGKIVDSSTIIVAKEAHITQLEKLMADATEKFGKLRREEQSSTLSTKSPQELRAEFESAKQAKIASLHEQISSFQELFSSSKRKLTRFKKRLKIAQQERSGKYSPLFKNEELLEAASKYTKTEPMI